MSLLVDIRRWNTRAGSVSVSLSDESSVTCVPMRLFFADHLAAILIFYSLTTRRFQVTRRHRETAWSPSTPDNTETAGMQVSAERVVTRGDFRRSIVSCLRSRVNCPYWFNFSRLSREAKSRQNGIVCMKAKPHARQSHTPVILEHLAQLGLACYHSSIC